MEQVFTPFNSPELEAAFLKENGFERPGENWVPFWDPNAAFAGFPILKGWIDPTRGGGQQINFGGAFAGAPTEKSYMIRMYDDQGNLGPESLGGESAPRNTSKPRGWDVLSTVVPPLLGVIGAGATGALSGLGPAFGAGSTDVGLLSGLAGGGGAAAGGALTPEELAAIYAAGDIPATEAALGSTGWLGATDAATYALAGTPAVYGGAAGAGAAGAGAAGAGAAANTAANAAKAITTGIPWLDSLLKAGLPVLGGALAGYEADQNNGQRTGDSQIRDFMFNKAQQPVFDRTALSGLIGQGMPSFNPQWTTQLPAAPVFSTTIPKLPPVGRR